MRSCDEITELISASLDGQLTADEQIALDEHIARCPACSALLDDLRALHTAAAEWEEVPAPAGFAASVMAAVAAEANREKSDNVIPFPAQKAKRTHWKQWTVSAAAVAIVVLGAVSAPSLTGNFAAKDAALDMDMSYAADSAGMEYQMETAAKDSVYYSVETETKAQNNPECSPAEQSAPNAKDAAAPSATPQDPAGVSVTKAESDVERYVGVLLLEGPLDALAQYEGAACSDGTVVYLVSADEFASVFELLEAEKPVGYGYAAGNPDAQLGKIVVQSN